MAISVSFNGVVYSIPETGDETWGENLTSYFVAIPQGALQKTGGSFTLTADVNFGANFGLLSRYFSTRSSNPSTAGLVRLSLSDAIGWRNNANNGNLLLGVNGSDQLTFNGSAVYPGGITALTGDVTATGPGSAVATISNDVITNVMINASAAIAYSKLNLTGGVVDADISASASIAFSKLATLSSGNILVGSAGNVATSVAVTGDVTISNAGVTAIGANKVTLAMLAQISTQTFLGRITASTGNVENLTATQATAILNAFVGDSGSGGTKGLVPAPAAGDAAGGKFLKADGTWVNPPGVGTVTSVGLTVPSFLSVSGSPVTGSGTLAVTLSGTALPVAYGGTGLTSGTSGGVLAYTASGTLASSGVLTANQLVIGGGAGAAPSVLAAGTQGYLLQMGASNPGYVSPSSAGASMVLIATGTASNSATIDFTSISNSTYNSYIITVDNVVPATNGVTLLMRVSVSGTFKTTDYSDQQWRITNAGSGVSGNLFGTGSTAITICSGDTMANSGTTKGLFATIDISNCAQTNTIKKATFLGTYLGSQMISIMGGGAYSPASDAVDGFRFFMSSGNISTGTFKLYGIRGA